MTHPMILPTPPPSRPPARPVAVHIVLVTPDDQPTLPLAPAAPPAVADDVDPTVARAVRAVVVVVAEALAGRRPVGQVRAVASGEVARAVSRLARTRWARDLPLRSLRVQQPASGVVEAAFHLGDARRSRPGAVRLERAADGWRCVVLDVGPA